MKSFSKKPRRAIALQYRSGSKQAPVISVTGEKKVADLMNSVARRYGIPIEQDSDLAHHLGQVPCAEEIPPELYVPVAKLLNTVAKKK